MKNKAESASYLDIVIFSFAMPRAQLPCDLGIVFGDPAGKPI